MIYDRLASSYASTRRPDPRIAARIDAALGDAETVVNVGAGTGSYEPAGREVTAVEPSAEMIAQRPAGAAPAVRASAEALPFDDDAFDAAMAVLTVHHWPDREAGLAEMRRVARRRVVIVAFDPAPLRDFWMVRDYFPAIAACSADRISSVALAAELPAAERRADPGPARLQRPLLRRALGPPGAGARPEQSCGRCGSGRASPRIRAVGPRAPRRRPASAPGMSATATCASWRARCRPTIRVDLNASP